MKKCQKCGTALNDDAKICGECGAVVSVFCPHCGRSNPSDGRFCSYCGKDMTLGSTSYSYMGNSGNAEDASLHSGFGYQSSSQGFSEQQVQGSAQGFTENATTEQPIEEKVNIFTALMKYPTTDGRATRKEFGLHILLIGIGYPILFIILALMWPLINESSFWNRFFRAILSYPFLIVPFVATRRLHDIGKSGWWIFLAIVIFFIPFLNLMLISWIIYWLCLPSEQKDNKYGPYTIAK